MGLMITNDGVDDDSDAVSGGDDYNNIGGCHCSDPLNHSSLVSCCTFSYDRPNFYSSDAFAL